jgi:hypothetical protein
MQGSFALHASHGSVIAPFALLNLGWLNRVILQQLLDLLWRELPLPCEVNVFDTSLATLISEPAG